jgi:hypothetical protein
VGSGNVSKPFVSQATGDLDGVGIRHADAFQELAESQLKAIVEAPDDSRIAVVFFAGRVRSGRPCS